MVVPDRQTEKTVVIVEDDEDIGLLLVQIYMISFRRLKTSSRKRHASPALQRLSRRVSPTRITSTATWSGRLTSRLCVRRVQESYAGSGRPSIDPVMFFKLQLVMFFEDIRSERLLMRHVADRLSVRWYLGYDLNESLPDHSSLTRIRERYGVEVFRRFFEQIVELCQQAGLIWGKEL